MNLKTMKNVDVRPRWDGQYNVWTRMKRDLDAGERASDWQVSAVCSSFDAALRLIGIPASEKM